MKANIILGEMQDIAQTDADQYQLEYEIVYNYWLAYT